MAQDLSQTIQNGLAQTLTDLLGIDAKFLETTKADRRDLQEYQHLEVNSEFEFDKLSSVIKFLIPATSASIIFNTMMGASDYEVADVLDDDTTDAMGEFVSNVSGSLVTAFNAKEVENLGKAKFHIQHKEIIDGAAIESIDHIFRFIIELDDQPITIFLQFDEEFYPFIEEVSKSEPTPYPEEAPAVEEEPIEELEQDIGSEPEEVIVSTDGAPVAQSETSETSEDSKSEEATDKDSDVDEESEEEDEDQKKSKKMKLLIIILSSFIGLVIIIFLVIFLMSSPEEEEMKKTEETKTEMSEEKDSKEPKDEAKEEVQEITTTTKTLKKIDFNIKDVDTARLNGRLATLTKFEILTKEELEAQKLAETKRLERLKKEEELKEFAKLNKEEPVKLPPKPEKKVEEKVEPKKEPMIEVKKEAPITPEKTIEEKVEPKEVLVEAPKTLEAPKQEIIKEQMKEPEIVVEEESPKQQEPEKLLFVLTNSIKYTLFKSLVSQIDTNSARISMCNDNEGRTTILIGPFETKQIQNRMDQLIKDSNENIATTLTELTEEEFNKRCDF